MNSQLLIMQEMLLVCKMSVAHDKCLSNKK